MDVLEDDLVHVDLQRGSLAAGENLDIRQRRVRLSELGASTYVLARGGFEVNSVHGQGSSTSFLAPYGEPRRGSPPPMISVRCANSGLRSEVPP